LFILLIVFSFFIGSAGFSFIGYCVHLFPQEPH
jgi:hypothetical protein